MSFVLAVAEFFVNLAFVAIKVVLDILSSLFD